MNISFTDNNRYLITLLAGIGAGLIALVAAGIIGDKYIVAAALPFLLLLTLTTFINLRYPLIFIILLRPLMDPLLEMTKVGAAGQGMGVGALLNGLIILLTGLLLLRERLIPPEIASGKNWMIFLLLCLVSLLAANDPTKGFRLFLNFLSYFCLFLLPFLLIKKKTDVVFWLRILLASGGLVITAGVIDFLQGGTYYPETGHTMRIHGPFLHPNILAFYLILIIVICLFVLEEKLRLIHKWQVFLLSAMILVSGFLILETKTRNAWIALWLLLMIYGLLRRRGLLLPLVVAPFALLAIPSFSDRVLDVVRPSQLSANINSYDWRVSLWKNSLPFIWKSPVIGHGLASFQFFSRDIFRLAVEGGSGAHNVFLQLLFETGILGLTAFLSIHWAIVKTFFNEFKAGTRCLILSLIGSYCAISFGDNLLNYLPYNWYYWFFTGLSLVYFGGNFGQVQCNNSRI